MSVEEGTHTLPDGTELYTKTWKVSLWSCIEPGWGRTFKTPKDRGNSGGTALVLSDIHSFLLSLTSQPNVPLFLMGHSMGGGEVLNYVLHPDSPYTKSATRPQLAGVMTYSPLIALDPATRPMALTVILGRLVARILPKWQRHSPLDPKLVCRDETVVADYAADELCHDIGTLEQLAGMLDRGLWLEKVEVEDLGDGKKLLPMWFGHGDADRITSWDATKKLAGVLGVKGEDVTFQSYEGAYHRAHMDPGEIRERFVKDVADWVLKRAPASEAVAE
ncbi:hypothetical protein PENSUB_12735 [Penicillium subrubescens]|uniref:Serine aminopeptidase S33 domain-containing protein n=1 Tax=Penicillium subrubescens TaxID=1316194 RepID=A0A1Q5SXT4_9EURO|nr:hypothetical protein PENSUB_12735 [Penicillium subrubescens]